MLRRVLPIFFLLSFISCIENTVRAQACTVLGQTPQTAFPVCGTTEFKQNTVPLCINDEVSTNGCGMYPDRNPFFYRFTCYTGGTLGFVITPTEATDDYDWQLFDISGHAPEEIYTNSSLFVVANWSGSYGPTGTSSANSNIISCGSDPAAGVTTFSQMPTLIEGHTYLLLVSHWNDSQSGYSLKFNDGTAVITDPLKPALNTATTNCSGEKIFVGLKKKVLCESLTANGTDFVISSAGAKIVSATGINCSSAFDMDSLMITLDTPLPPGDYTITIRNGDDANTLLDYCGNAIPENTSVPFTVLPLQPTPMDSLTPIACEPDVLRLVFKKPLLCSSVASNGSDFIVSGNPSITIASAFADSCTNTGSTSIIKIKLNKPIQTAGNFTITLQTGTDGNTLLDECMQETPAGSAINFTTADTVSARFDFRVGLGCVNDTLFFTHDGRNGVNAWNWQFDVNGTGSARDSFFLFKDYGTKHIEVNVSNGVCTDSAETDILLDNELIARLSVSPSTELCPEDMVQFADSSTGKIISWFWQFGDGTTSNQATPVPKRYPAPPSYNSNNVYPAALIVKNDIGCADTARILMRVYYSCYIAVPSAFTPNGDGLNDYLYPLNAVKADNLEFRIYNRWGQLVFETKDWTKKWDGRINGNPQEAGTYVWMLRYTDRDTGKPFSTKGTTVLIR